MTQSRFLGFSVPKQLRKRSKGERRFKPFKGRDFLTTMTKTSVGMALGGAVLQRTGGNIAQAGGQALQESAGFLPVLGTLGGAQMTLGALSLLSPQQRKRRRGLY